MVLTGHYLEGGVETGTNIGGGGGGVRNVFEEKVGR